VQYLHKWGRNLTLVLQVVDIEGCREPADHRGGGKITMNGVPAPAFCKKSWSLQDGR